MLRNSILESPLIVVEGSFSRYVDVATIQDGDSVLYKYHQKVGRGVYGVPSRISEKREGGPLEASTVVGMLVPLATAQS
jgi:hypothetical protein